MNDSQSLTYLNKRMSLFPEETTRQPMKRTAICARCHRPLSDPRSVEAGMGEVCRGHSSSAGKGETMSDETMKTDFTDRFDGDIPFGKAFVMKRAGQAGDADHRRTAITNVPHLVVHHSPDGFEFGYGGSGAADLALNVCQLYLNLTQYKGRKTKCYDGNCWALAWSLHQDFKREFIADVNWVKGASISFGKIDAWFTSQMTNELIDQYADQADPDEE